MGGRTRRPPCANRRPGIRLLPLTARRSIGRATPSSLELIKASDVAVAASDRPERRKGPIDDTHRLG